MFIFLPIFWTVAILFDLALGLLFHSLAPDKMQTNKRFQLFSTDLRGIFLCVSHSPSAPPPLSRCLPPYPTVCRIRFARKNASELTEMTNSGSIYSTFTQTYLFIYLCIIHTHRHTHMYLFKSQFYCFVSYHANLFIPFRAAAKFHAR